MSKITKLIEKVHGKVHDLPQKNKKQYSKPKIYTGGVDVKKWNTLKKAEKEKALSKPWYVRWSFRNPATGYLVRQDNIKAGANYAKTKKERMAILEVYRDNLEQMLKEGYSPYEKSNQPGETMTAIDAIDYALDIKSNVMAANSYSRYLSRINEFKSYLKQNGFKERFIGSVDRKVINAFLNTVLDRTSPRNRNNTRTSLLGIFQVLEDNEIIQHNFISKIKPLKATPTRNKSFTDKELKKINRYLDDNNRNLKLFIQFVSYNFLRPIEVVRLRVKDIDLQSQSLTVQAKNQKIKKKIIPDILIDQIPSISDSDPDDLLFTQYNGPGKWDATEENRRSNMGKQFAVVKNELRFGKEYGIYSFRHTYTGKLYKELRKKLSPFETKSKMMLITGHTTMTALEKYLRDIDAELPDDYSEYLK